jgi:hypothetical protein
MSIKLYWSGGNRHELNFGDTLSPAMVELLSGKAVTYADPSRCDMAAIGSILQKVTAKRIKRVLRGRFSPVHVWGTGAFSEQGLGNNSLLRIHALRGEYTRAACHQPDTLPLGDPGLLIDRFEVRAAKTHRWGIIPHVADT